MSETAVCNVPPQGWACTRTAGHDGPCAAIRSNGWAAPALGRAYAEVEKLREQMAQNTESGIDQSLRLALEAIEEADVELAPFIV